MSNFSQLKTKRLYFTILPACAVCILLAFFSCNKREAQHREVSVLGDYTGTDYNLKRLVCNLQELDKTAHFTSNMPSGTTPVYEGAIFRHAPSDSLGAVLFPVKNGNGRLEHLLIATIGKNNELLKAEVVSFGGQLKNARTKLDSVKIASLFYAFGKRGYGIPERADSLIRSVELPVKSGKVSAARLSARISSCEAILRCTIEFYVGGSTCENTYDFVWDQMVDYLCQKLQETISLDYGGGVSVFAQEGVGIRIAGPTDVINTVMGYELRTRAQAILNQFAMQSYSLVRCEVKFPSITTLEVIAGNCQNGGTEPPVVNCSDRTVEEAQEIVNTSLGMAEFTYDISPPLSQAPPIYNEEEEEYVKNESPEWMFCRNKISLGAYQQEYTVKFASERYVGRNPVQWKSFKFEQPTPLTINPSKGNIPPCGQVEMEVKSLTTNITQDKLKATAEIKYRLVIKIACVFGWQVGELTNADQPHGLINEFPASRNY